MAEDRPARQCGRGCSHGKLRNGLGLGCCKIASVQHEYDRILGQTADLLAQRGDEEAVPLLT